MQEHKHCCGGGLASPTAVDLSGWQKIVTKIAKDLHSGKIKPTDLSKDYINKTSETLREGIRKGYGKVGYNKGDIENIISMMRNAHIFSTYKNADFQQKVASKLYDKDGKPKPFHEFEQEVLKLNKFYNKIYLQAEYLIFKRSAQAVKQWEDIQRRKRLYPNLEYKTVGDNHVRDEHAVLNGKIRAIEHSFWDTYYPPNGWRCRCYVVQTDKPSNGDDVPAITEKNVPKMFQRNVGKDKEIFANTHPYFQNNKEIRRYLPVLFSEKDLAFKVNDWENGSRLHIHFFADINDLEANKQNAIIACKYIANLDIIIKEHVKTTGIKNPEYIINGLLGDLKTVSSKSSIHNRVSTARKQGCKSILINIDRMDKDILIDWLKKNYTKKFNSRFDFMIFIRNQKAIKLNRIDAINKRYNEIDSLYK